MKQLFPKCIAEFIGTFAIVFFGCGSIMVTERFPGSISIDSIPLIFGAVVATMIYTVGHISGAHFNPAVTLAFTIARHFPLKQLIPYFMAQFIGAIAAIFILHLMLPQGISYGATIPNAEPVMSFIWEIMLSFFLMLVITAVATDTRAVGMMAGIAIGTIVALCAVIGGPITGASMNPARSLAPAIFQGTLSSFWIYLFAPMIGATIAALVYRAIRCEKDPEKVDGCC